MAQRLLAWLLCAATLLIMGSPSVAAEVKLFSAVAVRPAILDLIPAFEQRTGHKVEWAYPLGVEGIDQNIRPPFGW
jgi:hypothetical protein